MPITHIGDESTDGNSTAIPAHVAGDLLLFTSFRDGSNSTPTKPADITQLDTNTSNSAGSLTGYKIAASAAETSGTWTNATEVSVFVYRGVDQVNPIGDHQPATGSSTTISFPALTMAISDGTSWVAGAAYHRSVDCNLGAVPTGMTLRLNEQNGSDEVGMYDTNGGVASWSLQTTAVGGTSSGWFGTTVEIRAEVDSITTSTSSTSVSTSTSISTSSTSSSVSTSISTSISTSSTSQSTSISTTLSTSTSISSTSSSTTQSFTTSTSSTSSSISTSSTSSSTSKSTSTSSTSQSTSLSTSSTSKSTSTSISTSSTSQSTSISTSSTSKSTSTSVSTSSTSSSTSISVSTSSTSKSTSTSVSTSTSTTTVTTTSTSSTSVSTSSTSTSLSTTTTLPLDPRSVPYFTIRNRLR